MFVPAVVRSISVDNRGGNVGINFGPGIGVRQVDPAPQHSGSGPFERDLQPELCLGAACRGLGLASQPGAVLQLDSR